MGKTVKAIDISPLSVEVMLKRGVKDACLENFFNEQFSGSFDTILMLMNGSGIVGKIANLPIFFHTLKRLLAREVVYGWTLPTSVTCLKMKMAISI